MIFIAILIIALTTWNIIQLIIDIKLKKDNDKLRLALKSNNTESKEE